MRLRTIAVGGGLLVLAALLLELVALHRPPRDEFSAGGFGPAKVLQLRQATLNQSEDDAIHLVVWADRVEYSEDEGESNLTNVRFVFYPDQRAEGSHEPIEGTADTASVRGQVKSFTLVGNAHIYQGVQMEVRGERLVYDYGHGIIRSREPVWLRNGETISEGTTLIYSIQERNAQLDRPKLYQ